MNIDVDCKNEKCPICQQVMRLEKHSRKFCINKCYKISGGYGFVDYYVFNEHVGRTWDDDFNFLEKRKIRKKIKYWIQDDRYLMKIMEG